MSIVNKKVKHLTSCKFIRTERQVQWNFLDTNRRKAYIKFEIKNKLCKSIIKNNKTTLSIRTLAAFKQSHLPRISSITKVVNRCVRTGRQFSVIHKTQLSRFPFRFQSYDGALPGVRRNSW
jgi:ribosomal protein S14